MKISGQSRKENAFCRHCKLGQKITMVDQAKNGRRVYS